MHRDAVQCRRVLGGDEPVRLGADGRGAQYWAQRDGRGMVSCSPGGMRGVAEGEGAQGRTCAELAAGWEGYSQLRSLGRLRQSVGGSELRRKARGAALTPAPPSIAQGNLGDGLLHPRRRCACASDTNKKPHQVRPVLPPLLPRTHIGAQYHLLRGRRHLRRHRLSVPPSLSPPLLTPHSHRLLRQARLLPDAGDAVHRRELLHGLLPVLGWTDDGSVQPPVRCGGGNLGE